MASESAIGSFFESTVSPNSTRLIQIEPSSFAGIMAVFECGRQHYYECEIPRLELDILPHPRRKSFAHNQNFKMSAAVNHQVADIASFGFGWVKPISRNEQPIHVQSQQE